MAVVEYGIAKGAPYWQTVPDTGGTIANGDVAIQFDDSKITSTSDLIAAIENLKTFILSQSWPA